MTNRIVFPFKSEGDISRVTQFIGGLTRAGVGFTCELDSGVLVITLTGGF